MGTDVLTTITAKEGYVPQREGVTSRTYEGNSKTTVEKVLRDIITFDLKLPIAKIHNGGLGDSKGLKKAFQGSTSYIGNSSEIINELTSQNELTWFVRDGKAYVYPINSSTKVVQARVISDRNGLLSSPESLITKADRLKDSKDLKNGFKLKVILDGTYNIGDLVSIDSLFVKTEGVYKITKIKTSGQFEGDDWSMELDVLEGVK